MTSLFQEHCRRWVKGCGSDQCAGALHVCLAKGRVPCDVLFVGEAPGESEDVLGYPFAGPAAPLLARIAANSPPAKGPNSLPGAPPGPNERHDACSPAATAPRHTLRTAFANLVGCIPREAGGGKA